MLPNPRRKLPKLTACMSRASKENMNTALMFSLVPLNSKQTQRLRKPLYKCLIIELKDGGFFEASNFLENILYDNEQLVEEDEIGVVVDLRKKNDYLQDIANQLKMAENNRERERTKEESQVFLNLGLKYAELGRGLLWLAEKFFLASIAVASQYLTDGGRWKGICMYYYALFLMDKFSGVPGADKEAFQILNKVRDSCMGKPWLMEPLDDSKEPLTETLITAVCLPLWRSLLDKARKIRKHNPAKAETLCRLAERRANDAGDLIKVAKATIEVGICQLIMKSFHAALKTFQKALGINQEKKNIEGQIIVKMHIAAAMQRLGDIEASAEMLNSMGLLAMEHGYRKHLGKALHLIGELHLRTDKPDLGTQHLCEAFSCFMGISYNLAGHPVSMINTVHESILGFKRFEEIEGDDEIFYEEAEQSRLMAAVSAGQELMASYFNLLKETTTCTVAQVKVIEWKLSPTKGWWITRKRHDFVPCTCPVHNRTVLDIAYYILQLREEAMKAANSEFELPASRGAKLVDIKKLDLSNESVSRSGLRRKKRDNANDNEDRSEATLTDITVIKREASEVQ